MAVARIPFALPRRVSVGLASWPADAVDRDALLERADGALYSAKRAGKDQTSLATEPDSEDARDDVLWTGLLNVLRAKDPGSLAHGAEVAALCVDVGRELGLKGERLADLRIAGKLHDVGKLAVPNAILERPGALNEEERRGGGAHPGGGARLMGASGREGAAPL